MTSRKTSSRVITLSQPALTVASGPAEKVYARAFDLFFSNLLAGRPAGDALKVQLPHYLPELSYGNRDIVGWTLSGSLVGLLAHYVGGEYAQTLHRNREQGVPGAMPVLVDLLEPFDQLILAHTATAGWQLVHSEPVTRRVAYWEDHDGQKFEAWTNACNIAARIRQQRTMPPLGDPLFSDAAHIIISELKVMLAQLRSQSLAGQTPPDLVRFFEQQAARNEFAFLTDAHTLCLWLDFVASKSGKQAFLHHQNQPSEIFYAFQSFVSGHDPRYVRDKRARG
jgi:hypothetical protein